MTAPGIRQASVADAREIVRLGELMYEAVHIAGTDEWRDNALRQVESRIAGPDLKAWVIDAADSGPGGTLAASALLNVVPRLAPPGQTCDHRGYIQWVSTDPAFRRRGYAKALMEALIEYADAHGFEVLELHSSPFGRQLYVDLGFSPFPAVDYPADVRGVPMIRKSSPPSTASGVGSR